MKFDALIIGGGPAGTTVALLLAQAGWSVALLEKVKFPRRKVCGEYLSPTNFPLLNHLGVAERFFQDAGPEIRQVGLFTGKRILISEMPRSQNSTDGWGRALGREHLDTLLLERAMEAGVSVWQPWSAVGLNRNETEYVCRAVCKESNESMEFRSRIVVAAHGSWESGRLPSHCSRAIARASDLFGFKAHFHQSDLPKSLMPLLVFPGGYGGMVHTDGGRVSLSCCVRRDWLERIRQQQPQTGAAETVLMHIKNSCRGVREALSRASVEGAWLSVGPIRPGIRARYSDGIFLVGNAAGEAHPVIAEGISMAMQSAWLLCERLVARRNEVLSGNAVAEAGRDYATAWRRNFAPRIRVAAVVAHLAMRPACAMAILPVLRLYPALLTWGARWSGKTEQVAAPVSLLHPVKIG